MASDRTIDTWSAVLLLLVFGLVLGWSVWNITACPWGFDPSLMC